jgi:glycosyltransferase involved in cell wall biosynthesis
MRVVFVTQRVDPEDPVLGATVAKIHALAAHCEEIVVLADSVAPGAVPANAVVHLYRARTRAGRGARFALALARELRRRPRPSAVVAHMCPIYAVLAAPLVRPLGVRVVLWYTHWKLTSVLALAARVSDVIATVDRRSVPVRSSKVAPIGHGIDMSAFSCAGAEAEDDGVLDAVVLGRYSASKGIEWILRAAATAREEGVRLRVRCHGAVGSAQEEDELRSLHELRDALGLAGEVELGGPVPRSRVPELLRAADVLINNMRAGATDKVVYEACASCLPVIVSNPPFESLLGDLRPPLMFERERPEDLAARIAAVAALSPAERRAVGETLRARVVAAHSVESWAAAMSRLCAAASS